MPPAEPYIVNSFDDVIPNYSIIIWLYFDLVELKTVSNVVMPWVMHAPRHFVFNANLADTKEMGFLLSV